MILGIDTSGVYAVISLCDNSTVLGDFTIQSKNTHSETVMPLIETMFTILGVEKKQIQYIAVGSGPGSFTGLRISASIAKGIAKGLGVKIIPVPTLDFLAYNIITDKLICPILDARRNEVYTGIYRNTHGCLKPICKNMATHIDKLLNLLKTYNEPVVFLGDGVHIHKEIIKTKSNLFLFAHENVCFPRGSSLALLAEQYKHTSVDGDIYQPVYLRKPQAERELDAKI